MKPPPKNWPRISSSIFYEDASAAIDWLVRAFGFEVRLKVEGEGGRIEHSELTLAEGLISVGSVGGEPKPGRSNDHMRSPKLLGGANTQCVMVYIDDVDAHCERARAAGGKVVMEPTTSDYGEEYWADRTCEIVDPEGHHWWFCQRMRG